MKANQILIAAALLALTAACGSPRKLKGPFEVW